METLQFTAENKLAKIEPTELEQVVKNSGLAIQEGEEIKKSYLPFLEQLAAVQSEAPKINYENPTQTDEMIARDLRLRTVKIRTGAEKLKDERKRMYLLRGNLEQASYNLIAASCKVTEEAFTNVEKAREIAEKKRKEALKAERTERLLQYAEDVSVYPLGEMSEDQFNALFDSFKTAYEKKIEAERKAEEERIAREKAEEAERARIKAENEKLKKDAEEKERLAEIERKKQAEIHAAQKAEADRKQKELQAKLAEEKRKADEEKRKADEERKKLEEQARKDREEKERLEAELKAKQEAEEKARKEDERKRKEAERKAKTAPDKEKLLAFGQAINDLPRPEIKSIEAAPIMANINALLVKLNNYIVEQANKL